MKKVIIIFCLAAMLTGISSAQGDWYTQGKFRPKLRIEFTLVNDLDIERINCPIIIPRSEFPMPDLHDMWVTVVDPALPPADEPSQEVLNLQALADWGMISPSDLNLFTRCDTPDEVMARLAETIGNI